MGFVAIVSCHRLEDPVALSVTLSSFLRAGVDVMVGYDRSVPYDHADILNDFRRRYRDAGHMLHVYCSDSEGIGNNRDFLAHNALSLGYSYVVQSDCHVDVNLKPVPMNSVYKHVPVDDYEFTMRFEKPGNPVYYGTIHSWSDIRSVRFVWEADEIPFFGEPVFVVDARDLRLVADHQCGYIYLLPGYSHEVADVMLSISMLKNEWFRCIDAILYRHRINKGVEERWTRRWDQSQLELFHANLTIYEAKYGFPKRYYNKGLAEKYRDKIECGLMLSSSAKVSAKEVFDEVERRISGKRIVVG